MKEKATMFYKEHKEVILYLVFGGLSFFLNIGLFALFSGFLHLDVLVANILCWILCVIFQFFTNRSFVFQNGRQGIGNFLKQLVLFFAGRIFSLVIEELILLIFIDWLSLNSMIVKLVAQIVVIILNYLISKLVVFKQRGEE